MHRWIAAQAARTEEKGGAVARPQDLGARWDPEAQVWWEATEGRDGEEGGRGTALHSPISCQCLSLAEINQKPVGKEAWDV